MPTSTNNDNGVSAPETSREPVRSATGSSVIPKPPHSSTAGSASTHNLNNPMRGKQTQPRMPAPLPDSYINSMEPPLDEYEEEMLPPDTRARHK